MGRDLAERSTDIMALWKKAERISGAKLREIYWDIDEEAMADTRVLQPALTVVNLALWLSTYGAFRPVCLAGHSLGEFSALTAAQALTFEQTIEIVSLRGRLMAEADPDGKGAMAAVLKLKQLQVEETVARVHAETGLEIRIANYNSPEQFVLSGMSQAIERAAIVVKELKGRCIPLPVSGAFHSPLMQEASRELTRQMAKMEWNSPRIPIFFNVSGTSSSDREALLPLMSEQMTSSVQWTRIIAGQWSAGVRRWIELGPKGVLTRLLKANLEGRTEQWEALNVATAEQVQQAVVTAP